MQISTLHCRNLSVDRELLSPGLPTWQISHAFKKKSPRKLNKTRVEEKHINVEALFKEEFGPSVMFPVF